MGKLDKLSNEWEELFVQHKNQTGDSVACLVNRRTKKRIYFDIKLDRILSKKEALLYTMDLTGKFSFIAS